MRGHDVRKNGVSPLSISKVATTADLNIEEVRRYFKQGLPLSPPDQAALTQAVGGSEKLQAMQLYLER